MALLDAELQLHVAHTWSSGTPVVCCQVLLLSSSCNSCIQQFLLCSVLMCLILFYCFFSAGAAVGFAAGLHRPVTLVVGDLSFLHDVNGLSLLRGGEMAPPLTVVLVNNKGGGIFSFLPVAGAVGQEAFERLWGTPQNVDLEGEEGK
jgi:hypothetical protein